MPHLGQALHGHGLASALCMHLVSSEPCSGRDHGRGDRRPEALRQVEYFGTLSDLSAAHFGLGGAFQLHRGPGVHLP